MAENNHNVVAAPDRFQHVSGQEAALTFTGPYTPQTTGLVSAWSSSSSSGSGSPSSSPLPSPSPTPPLPPSSFLPSPPLSPRLPPPSLPLTSEPGAGRRSGASYFRTLPKTITRAYRKRGRLEVSHAQRPRRALAASVTTLPTAPRTPPPATAPSIAFTDNGQIGKVRTSGTIGLSLTEFNTRLIEIHKRDLNSDERQIFSARINEVGEICTRDVRLDEDWMEVYAQGRGTVEGELSSEEET